MRPDAAPVKASALAPASASALASTTAPAMGSAAAPVSTPVPAPPTSEGFAFDDAALGRGMSAEVEALITRAGQLPHDPAQAEALLREAVALAPTHPAPLISLYRFHFYGHRLAQALAVADHALGVASAALGPQFGQVPPAPEQARHDAAVRFYLFTLKGQAYLSLRLGRVDAGRAALAELRRLDPQDCVGGGVLSKVLLRQGRDDEAGDGDASAQPETPRGWAEEPL